VIDWKLAGQVARGVSNLQPGGDPEPFRLLDGPAAESERLVRAYTGLSAEQLPVPEAVDRAGWIDANFVSLEAVLEPAARRLAGGLGPVGFMAGSILGLEAGAISGFLAGRVLGQYEFPVLRPDAPARLLFVAPNLGQAARSLDAPPDQLLRWVALHETTHALQFGGVPWLRGHIAGLVHEMLGALEVDAKQLMRRLPDLSDVKGFVARVREDGFATVVVGEEHRGLLDSVQAFMAVLEGYAEHVMDVTGAQVLDDLPALRSAMQKRRRDRSGFLRLLEKLLGMDLKLRQYEQGKAFCDGVVARAGIDGLNRVWAGPELLPTVAELADPAGWLARTERPELRRSA
jgi:coenzyme F420 biosynthesis associated uncharacterized protein